MGLSVGSAVGERVGTSVGDHEGDDVGAHDIVGAHVIDGDAVGFG